MVDGLKLQTYEIDLIIRIHEILNPDEFVERESGKQLFPIINKKYCLTFKIWYFNNGGAKLEIEGSIHKFYNSYFHNTDKNCDDFHVYQLWEALDALENNLLFDLKLFTLVKIEIGVNVFFNIKVNNLLKNHLHSYDKLKDTIDKGMKNNGHQLEYEKGDHLIKLYNKSAESKKYLDLNDAVEELRLEAKTLRSRETAKAAGQKVEKIYANALRDINILNSFVNYFLDKISNLLILDSFLIPNGLSKNDQNLFNLCSNIKAFYAQVKCAETKRTQFIKFKCLLEKQNYLKIHYELQNKVHEKIMELLQLTGSDNLTTSPSGTQNNSTELENLGFSTTKTINSIKNDGINPNESTQENLGFSTTKTINKINNDGINPDESTQENLGFSTGIMNGTIFNEVDWVEDTNDNELESHNDSADYQDYYLGMDDEISTFHRNEYLETNQDINDLGCSTLDKDGKPQIYCENNNINKIFQFIQPRNNYTAEKIFNKVNLDMDVEYLELVLLEMVNQEYLELHNDNRPYIYFIKNSSPF